MKYLNNAAGQALVLVVTITALLLGMSFTALHLAGEYRKTSLTERKMAQAYYIADAGVERALARAKADSDWLWQAVHGAAGREVTLITGENYAGGFITGVTVREIGIYPATPLSKHDVVYTDIEVMAAGFYDNSQKTLVVRARVSAPLPFVKGVWLAAPDPDFGCSVINAPVTVSGAADGPPFPVRQASMFAKSYDVRRAGNETIAGDFALSGITCVDGDLTISGRYRGTGVIVCRGNVRIPDDLLREPGAPKASLAILCFGGGGVRIADGAQVWALLYTPPGGPSGSRAVSIGCGAAVHGAILCDHIAVPDDGTALVQYESALAENLPDWLTAHVSITSWQELYPVF